MIEKSIRQLCLMSVLCGAAMSLSPNGGVKKIMSVLCTAVLALSIINPIKGIDFSSLSLETAELHEREAELSLKGSEINDRLNRLVIQSEYEAYIMDKAAELGLRAESAKVEAQWSSDGLWVPYSAEIVFSGEEKESSKLCDIIEAELGIPAERQYWSEK